MRKVLFSLFVFCLCTCITFGQNSLNDYLQFALKNSPVFIDNQSQMRSLAVDSMLIRAGLKPQVNFTSNNFYAPVINGYGYDEITTNKGNYNALLGMNLTIIGKNNLNNQYASLNIQKLNVELNTKLNERDLKQTVTSQYITVYGQQQILSNSEQVLTILQQENQILKNISEKGVYRQTDYLSFLVSYRRLQLAYSQLKLQMKNDLYLLNYMCGITDTASVVLSNPAISISKKINFEQASSFQQFLIDSLQLQNSIERLTFNYKPKLNLSGDAGYNTTFIYHAERNFGASVGLNILVPIYDGNQRKLQMNKFKLTENKWLNHLNYFRNQFTIKQIQLEEQISETDKLIEDAQDQLSISESLLKSNNKLLETGDAKISDYILSLTNYISSQITIQQIRTDKMQLINQFNYLSY